MKRQGTSKGPVRRTNQRLVDTAVKHADNIMRGSDKQHAVIFKPNELANRASKSQATNCKDRKEEQPRNSLMQDVLREALGILPKGPPAAPPHVPKRKIASSQVSVPKSVAVAASSKAPPLKRAAANRKASSSAGTRTNKSAAPKVGKTKSQRPQPASPPAAQSKDNLAAERKFGAERNAAARLEHNARNRPAKTINANPSSPFDDLLRRWQRDFAYLSKFESIYPDPPDVVAARQRLATIEKEWERRMGLSSVHLDYFPWPSTAAPGGGSERVATVEWEEIGMLSYLGYNVRVTSDLSTAQRQRLLSQVFSMQLPPLNSVTYMQSWAAPRTGSRLRKIAETLAALARNAKRQPQSNLTAAIAHWEDDLAHLRAEIYQGRFDFPWPSH